MANVCTYLNFNGRTESAFEFYKAIFKLYDALSEGGEVLMPLADMFWGAYFGELIDRFGVKWLVNVDHDNQEVA